MCSVSIQIGDIESFYPRDIFWPEVWKHFKHKNCLILIKISKSIYSSNLYRFKYLDHNWIIFMLKMFQYIEPKYVPSGQNVSIPPIFYTTTRCLVIAHSLICNCPLLKDISFSTKCFLVSKFWKMRSGNLSQIVLPNIWMLVLISCDLSYC